MPHVYIIIPYTTGGVHHTHTPRAVFQARLLDNEEDGANRNPNHASSESSLSLGDTFPTPSLCWHRWHYSNCGHVEHGKSAQRGCDIYTAVVYGNVDRHTCAPQEVKATICRGAPFFGGGAFHLRSSTLSNHCTMAYSRYTTNADCA